MLPHLPSPARSFVLTLKKGRYTYQFGQYAWTHMILLVSEEPEGGAQPALVYVHFQQGCWSRRKHSSPRCAGEEPQGLSLHYGACI